MKTYVAVVLLFFCNAPYSACQKRGARGGTGHMVTNMVTKECKTVGMTEAGIRILKKSIAVQQQEQEKPSMSPEAMEKLQTRVKELNKSGGMSETDLAFWDTCSENIKNKFMARRGGAKAKEEKKEEDKKDEEKKEEE
ncbi:uncharacterized protein LOC100902357 [Galendromus occidentalis]|uniref:Uncharacterized protein LOC100902357 n=1 Tax=Galendromus occidentalis TaxID=34638 RepID=A0AAJ6QUA3_9ACAR|nr:uncharacterized protein LOC100902357 [Galendromus occidentalis]